MRVVTPKINDHFLSNSKHLANSLLKKLNSPLIQSYAMQNKYCYFLLSNIEYNDLIKTKKEYNQLKIELEYFINFYDDNIDNFINHICLYSEFSQWFVKRNILSNIGRGSAASSILLYSLLITKTNPIEYNLNFDRFKSGLKTKDHLPDIDLDIPSSYYDQFLF